VKDACTNHALNGGVSKDKICNSQGCTTMRPSLEKSVRGMELDALFPTSTAFGSEFEKLL